jgi:hypothetical protein
MILAFQQQLHTNCNFNKHFLQRFSFTQPQGSDDLHSFRIAIYQKRPMKPALAL